MHPTFKHVPPRLIFPLSSIESSIQRVFKSSCAALMAATYPAGPRSVAAKHRALKLIDNYEKNKRNFYGGAIGYLDFDGNFNHAIIIRSFLSQDNQLHYQAGAGIVADSVPENELQEVYNKLGALDKALTLAEEIL